MLIEILKFLFSGIGGSIALAVIVSIWKKDQARYEREREKRIAERTKELEAIERDKKAQYAEALPALPEIKIPTEREYRETIRGVMSNQTIFVAIIPPTYKVPQTLRALFKTLRYLFDFSTPWQRKRFIKKKRFILEELLILLKEQQLLNRLAEKLW